MKKDTIEVSLPMDRDIYLTGNISEISIADTIKKIMDIRMSDKILMDTYKSFGNGVYTPQSINLFINSYGGEVYPMFSLIAIMDATGETPVNTFCFGYAMSAAFMIFIKGKLRHSTIQATLMCHQITMFSWEKLSDFVVSAKEGMRLQNNMNRIILENSKLTSDTLQKYLAKGDWFITPSYAKRYGFVDLFLETDEPNRFKKPI